MSEGLSLYHETDVAVRPLRKQSALALSLDDTTVSGKGVIVLSRDCRYQNGDLVYFDARGSCYIDELDLFVVDQTSILLREGYMATPGYCGNSCNISNVPEGHDNPHLDIAGSDVQVETPVVETPAVETPVVETPAVETPAVETPVVETPAVETPVVETPVVETPVVETPVVEEKTE